MLHPSPTPYPPNAPSTTPLPIHPKLHPSPTPYPPNAPSLPYSISTQCSIHYSTPYPPKAPSPPLLPILPKLHSLPYSLFAQWSNPYDPVTRRRRGPYWFFCNERAPQRRVCKSRAVVDSQHCEAGFPAPAQHGPIFPPQSADGSLVQSHRPRHQVTSPWPERSRMAPCAAPRPLRRGFHPRRRVRRPLLPPDADPPSAPYI